MRSSEDFADTNLWILKIVRSRVCCKDEYVKLWACLRQVICNGTKDCFSFVSILLWFGLWSIYWETPHLFSSFLISQHWQCSHRLCARLGDAARSPYYTSCFPFDRLSRKQGCMIYIFVVLLTKWGAYTAYGGSLSKSNRINLLSTSFALSRTRASQLTS